VLKLISFFVLLRFNRCHLHRFAERAWQLSVRKAHA
jgi:hypothetical protein